MQVVPTVTVRDGQSGFSILVIRVRIVSLPKNSLFIEKDVIFGYIEIASETLSKPTINTSEGTLILRLSSALQTVLATKSLQHIKHSGLYLSFKISVAIA